MKGNSTEIVHRLHEFLVGAMVSGACPDPPRRLRRPVAGQDGCYSSASTTTVPVIHGWGKPKYVYSPASSNLWENSAPGRSLPL